MEEPFFQNREERPIAAPLSREAFCARVEPAPGVRSVRRLALGTAWAGGVERREAVAALHAAWGAGFELADTAPMYKEGEAALGEALASWKGARPVINTKTLRSRDVSAVRARFEESERTLGPIDMLAVHDAEPDYPPEAIRDTTDFVWSLLESGRIRAAGQGGGGPGVQAQWLPNGPFRYVITHLRLDAVSLQALDDIVPLADRLGVAVFAASPLHLGLLGSNYRVFSEYPQQRLPQVMVERARIVKRLADEWRLPLTQVALRFVLSLPMVRIVISGAVTPEEWADCQEAYEAGPLPDELYEEIWRNACRGPEPFVGG